VQDLSDEAMNYGGRVTSCNGTYSPSSMSYLRTVTVLVSETS